MIDLHTHVLPGLDDGARTVDDSLEMLRIAAESGTTDLVASPHANLQFQFDPHIVDRAIADLAAASGHRVRLHRGCDFHLYFDNIEDALAHPRKYTINGNCYLLVEFPDLLIAKTSTEIFSRMVQAGMVPVITHPERNPLLWRRLADLRKWIELGCCLQVTGQSLLGRFGSEARNFARELMNQDLVHFIASDAHDAEDRTPRLDNAYQHIAKRWSAARAERLLVTNPRAALAGAPLPQPEPEPPPKRPWWRLF